MKDPNVIKPEILMWFQVSLRSIFQRDFHRPILDTFYYTYSETKSNVTKSHLAALATCAPYTRFNTPRLQTPPRTNSENGSPSADSPSHLERDYFLCRLCSGFHSLHAELALRSSLQPPSSTQHNCHPSCQKMAKLSAGLQSTYSSLMQFRWPGLAPAGSDY